MSYHLSKRKEKNDHLASAIDVKERMEIYFRHQELPLESIWKDVQEAEDITSQIIMLNDMGEDYRLSALGRLKDTNSEDMMKVLQQCFRELRYKRHKFDPSGVFPVVSPGPKFDHLNDHCNACWKEFLLGQDMISKSCGKCKLHRRCLVKLLVEGLDPLSGPCDCAHHPHGPRHWRDYLPWSYKELSVYEKEGMI